MRKETQEEVVHHGRVIRGQFIRPEGKGPYPVVIFSHGFNGNYTNFRKDADFMAEQGIASFCFDFCGGSVEAISSMDTIEMTITTECEDLRAVVDWVSEQEEVDETNLFLFGASMGGLVSALTTEQLQERVRGLVLLFPALCVADDWTKRYESLEDIPETVDLWGMTIGRSFVEEVYGMDVFSKLGSYQGEVLFFHGGYDSIVPISYSEKGSQLYAQSELTVYEEEGHGFSEESNQLVRERVVDFILHNKK